jgi:hypothetical protein
MEGATRVRRRGVPWEKQRDERDHAGSARASASASGNISTKHQHHQCITNTGATGR